MRKLLSITVLSGVTTFGLFAFMAFLISNDQAIILDPEVFPVVEVYQLKEDTKPMDKPRVDLTPPPPPAAMPKTAIAQVSPVGQANFEYNAPEINLGGSQGIKFDQGVPDSQARPVVRINPKYPIEAANNSIEGYVVLSFDINKIGQVINVNVVEAQPKRIFNKAAKRALKKWKYRAKTVDGESIVQENLTVKLDFQMNQQS